MSERRTRRIDAANLSVNITQLVAIVVFIWGVATMYQKLVDRLGDLQSQTGEVNERLVRLEGR